MIHQKLESAGDDLVRMLPLSLCRALWASCLCLALGRAAPAAAEPLEVGLGTREPALPDAWLGALGPTASYAPGERASRRGLWLGVSGGVAGSPGERERVFGLVELGLGLDDWVGGRSRALGAAPEAPGWPDTAADGSGPEPRAVRGAQSLAAGLEGVQLALPPTPAPLPAPSLGPAPPCAEPRSCDPASVAVLARAVVNEALRVRGGGTELKRLDGMASRSRAAASLPEVRLGAGTSRDESLRLNPTVGDPARFTRDGGRDLWLEARLTWRLDGALFASDEIAIMRLRAQQREDAAKLTEEVLAALVDWQRARLSLAAEAALPEERDQASVRQFGAVARLDVLTDGWFSRYLGRAWRAAAASRGPSACGSAAGGLQGPHGFRDPAGIIGHQEARRCAKGASLTSLNSNAN